MGERTLTMIQPGRLGDLIITLPIAYHYFQKGFKIIWPVCSEYVSIFKYVNFPIFDYDIGTINRRGIDIKLEAQKCIDFEFLDLAIGFGDGDLDNNEWKPSNLPFDLWKYQKANVDYNEKYRLVEFIKRNMDKEENLIYKTIGEKINSYVVLHEKGSHNREFKFHTPFSFPHVYVGPLLAGYTIFDWLSILEGAQAIYCVDSCIANLVDQWRIKPPQGRYLHKWTEYYTPEQVHFLTPQLTENWTIVT